MDFATDCIVQSSNLSFLIECKEKATCFYKPISYLPKALEENIAQLPPHAFVVLPNNLPNADMQVVSKLLAKYKNQIGGIVANSWGQLTLPCPVIAGEGLPITNREALNALKKTHVAAFTLWAECTENESAVLMPSFIPAILPVYNKQTVMQLNHCPLRVSKGMEKQRTQCNLCKNKPYSLRDRMGCTLPVSHVKTSTGCVLSLYNEIPTIIEQASFPYIPMLCFSTETPEEQRAIFQQFQQGIPWSEPKTQGHWRKGVQ